MAGRIRIFCTIFTLTFLSGCFFTDELGIAPANSVREDEVGRRVARMAATGWFAGVTAYSRARGTPDLALYDKFLAAYSVPFSAKLATYPSQTVFYTGPSVKLCEYTARAMAFSAAGLALELYNLKQMIADIGTVSTAEQRTEILNKIDFAILMSSFMAVGAADAGCRTELVRTGRLWELDRGRL